MQFKLSKGMLILLVLACLAILYLVFFAIGVGDGSSGVT